jgi:prolyl-tRNA synthetase
MILGIYTDFAENYLAMPVLQGLKTDTEKFAGAVDTYCIEALMQDGKSLQAGTSHFLGQNFAKAFDVKYADKEGKLEYVWATSWGVTTRLIGALIMTHSDDNGLILPPKMAPIQVVIIPIYKGDEEFQKISDKAGEIKSKLEELGISVKYDDRDTHKPGWKFNEYEFKGVPVRIAIGPRDLKNGVVEVARRDTLEKSSHPSDKIGAVIQEMLENIQQNMYDKALAFREENTTEVSSYDEFKKVLNGKGGFIKAHWDGTAETELQIKQDTKATIRCIPFEGEKQAGKCVFSGKPSAQMVIFAKAY